MEGGDLTFDAASANVLLPTADQPAFTVQLDADQAAVTIHRSDGPNETADCEKIRLGIGVQFIEGRFIVLGVNVEEA